MGGDARESLAPPKRATKKEKKENVRDGAFVDDDAVFGVAPFAVPRGALPRDAVGAVNAEFELTAPSARRNAARVLRAMQLTKPILLEGSPGVGKTSLISALAKAAGHRLTRVNLSEQTDMMDLLGADLPADGGGAGEFRWADGAFLGALKRGDWVLLDELNLAPQPVLEGLNAALDHRAEVFVPELGETFRCPPTFRVFAAQNPTQEGGGRKGLPKSFLNRFTRVHVEPMEKTDMAHITTALFPAIPASAAERAVAYVASLADAAKAPGGSFARAGAPWEFNLRDVLRWCELAGDRVSRKSRDRGRSDRSENTVTEPESDEDTKNLRIVAEALRATRETIFSRRLRRASDRRESARLFREAFAGVIDENVDDVLSVENDGPIAVTVDDGVLRVGGAVLATRRLGDGSSFSKDENSFDEKAKTFLKTSPSRRAYLKPAVLRGQTGALEAAAHCASRGWMTILVGPPASGKTSVAQVLADLAGRTLRRVALTAATDTSELLGSFEQKEPSRDRAALEASVTETLRVAAATALDGYSDPKAQKTLLDVLERAWSRWSAYRSVVDAAEARGAAAEDATAVAEALRGGGRPRRGARRDARGDSGRRRRHGRRRIHERKRGNGGHRGVHRGGRFRRGIDSRAARAVGPRGVGRRRAERRPVRVGGRCPAPGGDERRVGAPRKRQPVLADGAGPTEPAPGNRGLASGFRVRARRGRRAAGRARAPRVPAVPGARPAAGGGEPGHAQQRRRGVHGRERSDERAGSGGFPLRISSRKRSRFRRRDR